MLAINSAIDTASIAGLVDSEVMAKSKYQCWGKERRAMRA